jgi:hypothetical protein
VRREKSSPEEDTNGAGKWTSDGALMSEPAYYDREADKFCQMANAEPNARIREQLASLAQQYKELAIGLRATALGPITRAGLERPDPDVQLGGDTGGPQRRSRVRPTRRVGGRRAR